MDVTSLRDELLKVRAELDGLREAMSRRAVIEQAKGVFMERYGVDDEGAFARLVSLSQSTNVKLVQIAADVVARSGVGNADNGRASWIDRALDAFGEPALVLSPVPTERGTVADFQVDHANRSALRWMGRPRERVVRGTTTELFPAASATVLVNACRRTLATGTAVGGPWLAPDEDGNDARRGIRLHATRITTVVLVTWQRATVEGDTA
ncbi:ANTAR domain-containing protein [Cryptosporangium sp. NPDC048952]|uniref:ANTAR domain-containing protein n=1 Tax=Cryptosporangium sp. NPDC048952 TaxID=3363961 RepID=UPI00371461BB